MNISSIVLFVINYGCKELFARSYLGDPLFEALDENLTYLLATRERLDVGDGDSFIKRVDFRVDNAEKREFNEDLFQLFFRLEA